MLVDDRVIIIKEAEERYRQRRKEREATERKIRERTPLDELDTRERVSKRRARLGACGIQTLDEHVYERTLGGSDLMPVSYLELGLLAARAVARVWIRDQQSRTLGYGTGFLVSPRLFLTNHHVLPDKRDAATSVLQFNYQYPLRSNTLASVPFSIDLDAFFVTEADLDYTLVAVEPRPGVRAFGWLPLIEEEGKVVLGEYVSVIQHPQGEPKQVALRENQLIDVLPQFLHYRTDTEPGSSGSPVFNDQWEVVALHHSGVPQRDANGNVTGWVANEGVRISQIVKHLKTLTLPAAQNALRKELLDLAPVIPEPSSGVVASPVEDDPASPRMRDDGTAVWSFPLSVSVRLGAGTEPRAESVSPIPAPGSWPGRDGNGQGRSAPSRPGRRLEGLSFAEVLDRLGLLTHPRIESRAREMDRAIESESLSVIETLTDDEMDQLLPAADVFIAQLARRLASDEAGVLEVVRGLSDDTLTSEELLRGMESLQERLTEEGLERLESLERIAPRRQGPPESFTFPRMSPGEIDINLFDDKYEPGADALGYAFGFLLANLRTGGRKDRFRSHTKAESKGLFRYPLHWPDAGRPLDVALFSDFGCGRYHSLYVSKYLVEDRLPYAIHLGDVYYAGTKGEFKSHLSDPFAGLLDKSRLFLLSGNHEMYSGGKHYFRYIDEKRREHSIQEQEGSYFALFSEEHRVQIVGVDLAYFAKGLTRGQGHLPEASNAEGGELKRWLRERLDEGAAKKWTNVLLTSYEPYDFRDGDLRTFLTEELGPESSKVHLWFWGNTHYCGVFGREPQAPNGAPFPLSFVGSCIGHGGFPYKKVSAAQSHSGGRAARLLARGGLEERTRFPELDAAGNAIPYDADYVNDRGNNGFCVMRLHPGGRIELIYRDWMDQERARFTLTPQAAGGPLDLAGQFVP